MEEFTYAHNDTSVPERQSRTQNLNVLKVSEEVALLRQNAFEKQIPVASSETLNFVITLATAKNATNILEVGSAVGITAFSLLSALPNAKLTAIERDDNFFAQAKQNLSKYADRSTVYHGEAVDVLSELEEKLNSQIIDKFDFIFLDCAKVQYIKLLPILKKILKANGILLADDVLLYGWVNGEVPTPKKRKMLVQHVREYITAVTNDDQLATSILDVGDGLAMSVKKYD